MDTCMRAGIVATVLVVGVLVPMLCAAVVEARRAGKPWRDIVGAAFIVGMASVPWLVWWIKAFDRGWR